MMHITFSSYARLKLHSTDAENKQSIPEEFSKEMTVDR